MTIKRVEISCGSNEKFHTIVKLHDTCGMQVKKIETGASSNPHTYLDLYIILQGKSYPNFVSTPVLEL
jgi:hypothetical protein